MEAFLKGGKLPTGKNQAGSGQKQLKDKKQRDKPLPWVEKVNTLSFVVVGCFIEFYYLFLVPTEES